MEISLELMIQSDFPCIVKWVNAQDEDFIVQWAGLTYKYPLTLEQMDRHYSKGLNSLDADVFMYKILDSITGEMIGSVQICRFDHTNREAVIGRFLLGEEKYRGHGIGTLALKKAVEICFQEFKLTMMKLNVFDTNKSAIRCYEKVGFKIGKRTENVYQTKAGEVWSNYEMALEKETHE